MAQALDAAGVRLPGQGFPDETDEEARLCRRIAAFGMAVLARGASYDAANRLRGLVDVVRIDGIDMALIR